ncbi:hypothetical protein GKO32_30365 [Amycolatopsis sp. RM579]|uniref:Uncharacterized protein n=2 Tax=Amycolatopsis pithecellobii TaxID=664692 RepID=A0A6N7Z8S0_9PSEU|nr:hypothetical protein [Amycolatopsis pithecellobii]
MRLNREVANPELDELVGFTLDGPDRKRLNELELVDSRKVGRPYVHVLTERGWSWCEQELSAKTPPATRPRNLVAVGAYLLLDGFGEYLRRENLRLADLFGSTVDLGATDIESRIRIAYRELARSPRDWVGLADLRPKLGGAPAGEVDAVLKELYRTGQAQLVPESNRKALTEADHDAAIRVGGEDNHLLSIEVS